MGCVQGKARLSQEVPAETSHGRDQNNKVQDREGGGLRAPGKPIRPFSQPISRTCSILGTWLVSRHSVLTPQGGANSLH